MDSKLTLKKENMSSSFGDVRAENNIINLSNKEETNKVDLLGKDQPGQALKNSFFTNDIEMDEFNKDSTKKLSNPGKLIKLTCFLSCCDGFADSRNQSDQNNPISPKIILILSFCFFLMFIIFAITNILSTRTYICAILISTVLFLFFIINEERNRKNDTRLKKLRISMLYVFCLFLILIPLVTQLDIFQSILKNIK